MSRAAMGVVVIVGFCVAACSGKAERGGADDAPADKPAVGANAAPRPKPSDAERRSEPDRHLLMVVELSLASRSARVLKARPVDLPLPRRRGPTQRGPWQVDVLDGAGSVLYTAPLSDGSALRGEFENDRGELTGSRAQKQLTAVTLRLPLLDRAVAVRVSSLTGVHPAELGRVAYPVVSR